MVSVLEGQLSRTWNFINEGRSHIINLYHDTITGVRSAMFDFSEIRGSTGNSSVLMDSKGHRIFFSVDSLPGYIEIKKSGWTGFAYTCVINNVKIPEATEIVAQDQSEVFKVKISGITTTQDELVDGGLVSWYIVETVRLKDGMKTVVHRRFKDFAELNSQVKQNFKGHHLRQSLPMFPEKPLKSLTDHRDPAFLSQRQIKLELFLMALVNVPHVANMVCTRAFVGLMEAVREYSISFHVPQLGMTLLPLPGSQSSAGTTEEDESSGNGGVAVVGSILNESNVSTTNTDGAPMLRVGDSISKINGIPVSGLTFAGMVNRIKLLPRPIIVHFIQVMKGESDEEQSDSSANSPKSLPGLRAAGVEAKAKVTSQSSNWTTYDDHEEDEKEELAKAPEPLRKPPSQPAAAPVPSSSQPRQHEYPIHQALPTPVVVGVMDKGKSYNGLFGEEEEPVVPPPPAHTTITIDIDPFDPLPVPKPSSGFEEVADEEVEVLDEPAAAPAADMPPAPLGWD